MTSIPITFVNPRGGGLWAVEWPAVPRVGEYVEPPPLDRGDPYDVGEPPPDLRARGAVTHVRWEAWPDGTVSAHLILGTER